MLRANLTGAPAAAAPSSVADAVTAGELALAAMQDADFFRIQMRTNQLLDGLPLFSDPDLVERVRALVPARTQSPTPDGPNRPQLVDMLSR